MARLPVFATFVLLVALISAINCQDELASDNNNSRDKRTAPLFISFLAKKFGYHLHNGDIFGNPDEIVLRRAGYHKKPNRRPFPQANLPPAIDPPIAAVQPAPAPQPAAVAPQWQQPQTAFKPQPQQPAQIIPAQPQWPSGPSAPQQPAPTVPQIAPQQQQQYQTGPSAPSQQPAPIVPQVAPQQQYQTGPSAPSQQPAPMAPQQPAVPQMPPQQQQQYQTGPSGPAPFPGQPQVPSAPQPAPQQPQFHQQRPQYNELNFSDKFFHGHIGNYFPFPFPFPQQPQAPSAGPVAAPPQRPVEPQPQPIERPQMPSMPIPQRPAPAPMPVAPKPSPVQQTPPPPQMPPRPIAQPSQELPPSTAYPELTQVAGQQHTDIDVTEFQRKTPDDELNVFGRAPETDFDFGAINPRTKDFENFQFVNFNQESAPQQAPTASAPTTTNANFDFGDIKSQDFQFSTINQASALQEAPTASAPTTTTNDLAQQYEGIASPSYDNDVLLKGFVQDNIQQVEPSAPPTTATSDAQEGQFDFNINVPEQQSRFEGQSQQQEQVEDKFVAPTSSGFDFNQNQFQQTYQPQQTGHNSVVGYQAEQQQPLEQGGRNNFPQYQSQQAPRGGRILNLDQLEYEIRGRQPQRQQQQQQVDYQPESHFRSEVPSNRGLFNIRAGPSSGQHDYNVQIVKAVELYSDDNNQPFGFQGQSSSQNFESPSYLPPLQNLQRRHIAQQGKGQSTSSMSFRSNNEQYAVQTNHNARSKQ